MSTLTTHYGFTKPDIGNSSTWGTDRNNDLDTMDSLFASEAAARATADAALTTDVATNSTAISNEVTRATTAEAGKQASLGFTAENVANKDITATLGTSDTNYPSQKAVKSYVDTAISSLHAITFGRVMSGISKQPVYLGNAGSGDVDLFTVPLNSRAFFCYGFFNSAATATTYFHQVKIGGVYYRVNINSAPAGLGVSSTGFASLVLEAGQSFAVNTSQAGMNFFGTAIVFPNTERIKSTFATHLNSGDNTVYTCPVGKTATIVLGNNQLLGSGNAAEAVVLVNTSGGSLNYYMNVVPRGNSPATANKFSNVATVADKAILLFGPFHDWTLNAGDYISINASGSGNASVYVTVEENPA